MSQEKRTLLIDLLMSKLESLKSSISEVERLLQLVILEGKPETSPLKYKMNFEESPKVTYPTILDLPDKVPGFVTGIDDEGLTNFLENVEIKGEPGVLEEKKPEVDENDQLEIFCQKVFEEDSISFLDEEEPKTETKLETKPSSIKYAMPVFKGTVLVRDFSKKIGYGVKKLFPILREMGVFKSYLPKDSEVSAGNFEVQNGVALITEKGQVYVLNLMEKYGYLK